MLLSTDYKGFDTDPETKDPTFSEIRHFTTKFQSFKENLAQINQELCLKSQIYQENLKLLEEEGFAKDKKISELENSLKEINSKYLEEAKKNKGKNANSLKAEKLYIDDLEKNKRNWERKKKYLKETLQIKIKEVEGLESEKAVLIEKLCQSERRYADMDGRYKQEIKEMRNKIYEMKDSDDTEEFSVRLENERLKTRLQMMENKFLKQPNPSDHESKFWQTELNHLIQQRDAAKAKYLEINRELEETNKLFEKKIIDKEKYESTITTLVHNIQTSHANELKSLKDKHELHLELVRTEKDYLEKQLKTAEQNVENEKHKRVYSKDYKKLAFDMKDGRNKLAAEVEALKTEKGIVEKNLAICKTEKDQLMNVIGGLESKIKSSEERIKMLVNSHKSDLACWNTERDQLTKQKHSLTGELEKVKKQKEDLVRENEKLKIEKKRIRQDSGSYLRNSKFSNQHFAPEIRSIFTKEKDLFKELSSPLSRDSGFSSSRTPKSDCTRMSFEEWRQNQ